MSKEIEDNFAFEDRTSDEGSNNKVDNGASPHLNSSSARSETQRNPSRSNKNGLPNYIVKQLLQDIESSSG
jgi:hypothetical protein